MWNSTLNTARGYQDDEQDKEVSDNPDDVITIDNPGEVNQLSYQNIKGTIVLVEHIVGGA